MNTTNAGNNDKHAFLNTQNADGTLMPTTEDLQLLQTVFDASPNTISVFSIIKNKQGRVEDFKILMINKSGIQITKRTDLVGKIYSEAYPHSKENGVLEAFKKVAETGEMADFERPYEGNGLRYWFRIVAQLAGDKLVVTAEDISPQKQATQKTLLMKEQQANNATEKYDALFKSIDQGFCTVQLKYDEHSKPIDYQFIEVSPSFEQQTGINDGAGKWMRDIVPDEDAFWFETYGRIANERNAERFEYFSTPLNRWWSVYAFPINEPELKQVGILFNDITEQIKAKKKIEESENRFRTMADASPMLIWTIDANCLSSYYNKTLLDFIGVSKDEDISDWKKIVHPDDVQSLVETINTAIDERHAYSLALRLLRFDGQWRWVLAQGNPMLGAHNEFVGFIGSSVDITDRKLAEDKIKKSEVKYKSLIDTAPVGIGLLMGPDLILENANQKYMDLLGKGNDIEGKKFTAIMPELIGQPYLKIIDDIFITGKSYQSFADPVTVNRNGIPKDEFYDIDYTPLFDGEGKVYAVLNVATDVTVQTQLNTKLKESEKQFKNVLLHSPNLFGILEGYPEMIISFANEPLIKSWGRTAEIIGKPLLEVLPEIKDQVFPKLLKSVFETGETYYSGEEKAVFIKDGIAVDSYFLYVYQAIFDEQQKVTGITMMATDITEQVTARKKIEESEKRFSKLLLESPFAVAILKGHDMIVALANDAIKHIWGKGNDVEDKSLFALLPEIKEQGFPALLEEVYTTGKPFYGHEVLVNLERNGIIEDVYFNFVYQPYREVDETISGVTIIANEVTIQAIANKKIAASEENVRRLFMQAPAIICVLRGPHHVIQLANEGYMQFVGKRDMLGKPIREALPELEGQVFYDLLDSVYATGVPFIGNEVPGKINREDGKLDDVFLNFVYQASHNNEGEINGILVHAVDVTEQVLLRKQTEESEERQAFLLKFSDTLRTETTEDAIANFALQMLFEHLKLDRCYIGVYKLADDRGEFPYQVGNDRVPTVPESVRLSDFPEALRVSYDRTLVIDDISKVEGMSDTDRKNLGALGLCAIIAATLRNGKNRPLWSIVAVSASARYWVASEIKLMEEVTERTWAAIERAKAEEALKDSKKRFQSIANLVPDLLWCSEPDGATEWYNQRWLEYTGQSFEEAIGWGWVGTIHPDDREGATMRYNEAVKEGKPLQQEHRIRSLNGEYRWFIVSALPLKDENGRVLKMYGAATDIHNRKEAEEAMQMSEQRLKLLTESLEKKIKRRTSDLIKTTAELASNLAILQQAEKLAQIGSWEYDYPTGSFTWSEGMYILFGLPKSIDLVPEVYVHSSAPDEVEAAKQTAQYIRGGLLPLPDTVCIKTPNGVKTVKLEAIVVNDMDGKPLKMIGVDMDITAERAAAKKMEEQAHFIQSTNDALPDILFVMNLHTKETVYINHSFEETLGYPEVLESSPKKNIVALIYEEDVPVMLSHLDDLKNSADGEVFEIEYRLKAADGSFRWFSDRNTVFKRDRNGVPSEKIGIAQDITIRKKAEQELKESNTNLRYANENLQQFASIAAHDLQEPLRKIQFFTSVIKANFTEMLPVEGQEVIQKINKASARMSQLIKEVLQYSKIAYSEKEFVSCKLDQILQNVLSDLDMMTEEADAKISYLQPLPVVEANPLQMHQLFSNIVINAVKYREKKRALAVDISFINLTAKELKLYPQLVEGKQYIHISISDNGIGFNPLYAEQIFSLFERLHNDDHYEGTGVGLALCKKIVENHNGHIFATSKEGQGTIFQVILPLHQK